MTNVKVIVGEIVLTAFYSPFFAPISAVFPFQRDLHISLRSFISGDTSCHFFSSGVDSGALGGGFQGVSFTPEPENLGFVGRYTPSRPFLTSLKRLKWRQKLVKLVFLL